VTCDFKVKQAYFHCKMGTKGGTPLSLTRLAKLPSQTFWSQIIAFVRKVKNLEDQDKAVGRDG
jgi:hypothetical protein